MIEDFFRKSRQNFCLSERRECCRNVFILAWFLFLEGAMVLNPESKLDMDWEEYFSVENSQIRNEVRHRAVIKEEAIGPFF